MVRITAQLLSVAEQRVNPLQGRELVLRGLGIAVIENMAAAPDQYDCWDMSNNFLTRIENLPKRKRLAHLLLSNNKITTIAVKNLLSSGVGSNLITLTLSHNNIQSLQQVSNLGKACPKLEFLSLNGNPVTRRQHYRLYTIHCMPATLKVLDYSKIKPSERDRASRLARSAAGAALQSDIQQEEQRLRLLQQHGEEPAPAPKTFVPGGTIGDDDDSAAAAAGGAASASTTSRSFVTANFTAAEKEAIRQLLSQAASVQQVEEIEHSVRQGILPPGAAKLAAAAAAAAASAAADATATTNGEGSGEKAKKKRPREEHNDDNINNNSNNENKNSNEGVVVSRSGTTTAEDANDEDEMGIKRRKLDDEPGESDKKVANTNDGEQQSTLPP